MSFEQHSLVKASAAPKVIIDSGKVDLGKGRNGFARGFSVPGLSEKLPSGF